MSENVPFGAYHRDEEDGPPAIPARSLEGDTPAVDPSIWFGSQPFMDFDAFSSADGFALFDPRGASNNLDGGVSEYFTSLNTIATVHQTTVQNELQLERTQPATKYVNRLGYLLDENPFGVPSTSNLTPPLEDRHTDSHTLVSSDTQHPNRAPSSRKSGPPTKTKRQRKRKRGHERAQINIQLDQGAGRRNASTLFAVHYGVRTEIENRFFALLMKENFFPNTNEADVMLIAILNDMGHCESRRFPTIIRN